MSEATVALARDEFLAATLPTKKEWVPMPHLGDGKGVFVRLLTAAELDDFESPMVGKEVRDRLKNLRGRFAAFVCCDAEGNRLFSNVDATALGERDHKSVDLIFEAGRKLNGMFQSEAEAEAAAKN